MKSTFQAAASIAGVNFMLAINYGWCTEKSYLDAGEAIVRDFDQGNMSHIVDKINAAFFKGGVFAIKSFSDLLSIDKPYPPVYTQVPMDGPSRVEITRDVSLSASLGYVEAIPLIGSVIAMINAIGQLFYMLKSYQDLKRAVIELKEIPRNDYNVMRGASLYYTKPVVDSAVNYTVHRNHLIGSLISIVPLAKPLIRLAQGILYELSVQQEPIPG